jgi:hypothetical protein
MWCETPRVAGSRNPITYVETVSEGGGPIPWRKARRKKGYCDGLLGDTNGTLGTAVLVGTPGSGGPVEYAVARHHLLKRGGDELSTAIRFDAGKVVWGCDGDGVGWPSVGNAG